MGPVVNALSISLLGFSSRKMNEFWISYMARYTLAPSD